MIFIRTYRTELLLAALAFFVHIVCFAVVVHANQGNVLKAIHGDDGYFELAQNVAAGNGFSWSSTPPYAPNPLRTPGYIYVLAGLFSITGSIVAAAWIQLLAATAIPIFGMRIAQHITSSTRIGVVTGVILACNPTLALLSFQFFTETLFLLLFFPGLLASLRYLHDRSVTTLLISAVLLGFAILTKTSAQYIPIIFVPFILWSFRRISWGRGVAHAGLYLLVIGAILAPWVIRNITIFGEPGLSAQSSFVLYTNLAPAVLSVANHTPFTDTVRTFLTPEEFKGDAITLQNADAYTKKAVEIALTYPRATIYIAIKSLFTFFTSDGMYPLLTHSGHTPSDFLPLLIGARLIWVFITIAAGIGGLIYLYTHRTSLAVFSIILVAYFALTSTIAAFGTNPRYRLPVDPIIIPFAAIGAGYLLHRARQAWTTHHTSATTVHSKDDCHT